MPGAVQTGHRRADRALGAPRADRYRPRGESACTYAATDAESVFRLRTNSIRFGDPPLGGSSKVVQTVVKYKTTRIANGRAVEMNLHHLFRFRDDKIAYVRSAEDTSQIEAIFRD
jgi:hypothetical protein